MASQKVRFMVFNDTDLLLFGETHRAESIDHDGIGFRVNDFEKLCFKLFYFALRHKALKHRFLNRIQILSDSFQYLTHSFRAHVISENYKHDHRDTVSAQDGATAVSCAMYLSFRGIFILLV